MKRIFLLLVICVCVHIYTTAQKTQERTLSAAETKEIITQLKLDTARFLSATGYMACSCIDSINGAEKNIKQVSKEIAGCIDEHVSSFQMAVKLMNSMKNNTVEININTDKNSKEYINDYRLIERWLRDSCRQLAMKMASNEKSSDVSISKNPLARDQYNQGIENLAKDNFTEALPYFKKAVEIDPAFAFAWDNLGICYRRTQKYPEAIAAYKTSIALDPANLTPLQNLPVVYELMKDYDKAIEEYKNILKLMPDEAEAFYGIARMYIYKNELENGLQFSCKAYNVYTKSKSPYRVDAENLINEIYSKLKKADKLDLFKKILKENNINIGQ